MKDKIGREGYGRVAAVERYGIRPLVFIYILHEVFDTVARQCGVDLPVEPLHRPQSSLQFDAGSIRVGHVDTYCIAGIGELSGDYELILVVHKIEISSGREERTRVGVAELVVKHAFGIGIMQGVAVGEVVAGRFLVRHAPRCVDAMPSGVVCKAEFRVEEIPVAVQIEPGHASGIPVVVVAYAVDSIVNVAKLKVGIGRKSAHYIVIGAYKEV